MGNREDYRQVVGVLAEGKLRPVIDSTFPLEDGANALRRLEQGEQMGKVVVEIP
jgi:NADPH:quinone reductase-like Zn-dependent oxidoreductase